MAIVPMTLSRPGDLIHLTTSRGIVGKGCR
jgi:hypothetical protein